MMDRTEKALARWRRLLQLEQAEGRSRFDASRAGLTPVQRAAAGVAWTGLVVQDTGAGALGRAAWLLVPRNGELAGGLSPGDPVRLYAKSDPEAFERGLITRRTRRSVTVVFDEPPEGELEDADLVLEREFDETTHRRLLGGLAALETGKGRTARWRELLFEGSPPSMEKERPFVDAALNEAQREAAGRALAAEDVALVHGPPGTGKTQVLAAIAQAVLAAGGTVLACAASNAGVDNLVQRLAARGLDPLRLGHPARVHPEVVDCTLEARSQAHEKAVIAEGLVREARELMRRADRASRQGRASDRFAEAREARAEGKRLFAEARRLARAAEEEVLSKARVVCATLTGLERLGDRRFAMVILDEATQATLPACVLALVRADRAVLAGDHHQLPPTVLSAEASREGLGVTLFEALQEAHGERIGRMLEVQHRMHEAIMAFPSRALYDGRLVAHPSVAHHTVEGRPPLQIVDAAGKGWAEERPEGSESLRNPGEAERVVREVQELIASGLRPDEIGVIAPYGAQVALLRSLLPDDGLEVDTVDAFQGREKEAVVVSLVRSNDAGELGFVADVRRLNVALTRARRRLFVVGDSATLGAHPFHESLWQHAQGTGAYTSAWEE
jgi:ATP-dependent RNA/DNA helicase IGHMBP2